MYLELRKGKNYMNKLHYVNTDETHKKSADLRFDYVTENGDRIYVECDTIIDFIDTMESDEVDIPMLDYSDVHAKFFDNEHNTKVFNTVGELLEHCKQIVK